MQHYQCKYYMDHQSDINSEMRAILIDWLFSVANTFKQPVSYVHRAIKYLDIFIEHQTITRKQLELYGCAALSLVDRYYSRYPTKEDDWIYISDHSYSKEELFKAEFKIFEILNYNVLQTTYFDITRNLLKTHDASVQQIEHAEFIANFLLHYYSVCTINDYCLAQFITSLVTRNYDICLHPTEDLKDHDETANEQYIVQIYHHIEKLFKEPHDLMRSKIRYLFKNKNLTEQILLLKLDFEKFMDGKIQLKKGDITPPLSPNSLKTNDLVLVSINDLIVKGRLGEGVYGKVYVCERKNDGSKVAVKKFINNQKYELNQSILRDTVAITRFDHPNIVGCKNIYTYGDHVYAILELGDSNLREWITTLNKKTSDESANLIKKFIKNMIDGLHEIHSKGFIHRDLKPDNMIVFYNNVKISDFGLTVHESIYYDKPPNSYSACTLWYRPPELLLEETPNNKSLDVWSLGCIIVELLIGEPLFPGDSEIDQLFKIFQMFGTVNNSNWENIESNPNWKTSFPKWNNDGQFITLLNKQFYKLEPHQYELLIQMFEYNPKKRIAIDEIVTKW